MQSSTDKISYQVYRTTDFSNKVKVSVSPENQINKMPSSKKTPAANITSVIRINSLKDFSLERKMKQPQYQKLNVVSRTNFVN